MTGTIILHPDDPGGEPGPGPATFLDNLNGSAGVISGNADTGQERQASNGIILLTGDGAARLDDNNSPDIALLQWAGVTIPDGSTFKVTLSTFEGDSPIVFFNADLGFTTPGAWGLYINDDDNRVVLYDYSSIIYPSPGSNEFFLPVATGITPAEAVEVTVTINGDSITLSANGSSDTFTVTDRPYSRERPATWIGGVDSDTQLGKSRHKPLSWRADRMQLDDSLAQ